MRSAFSFRTGLALCLVSAAMLYPVLSHAASTEQPAHEVCSIKDFAGFLERFSELPFSGQVTCVRFPLRDRAQRSVPDEETFLAAFGDVKFVYSPANLASAGARPSIMFFDIGKDSTAARDIYGYFIEHASPTRKKATLTEGGTFELSTTIFEWNGKFWQVTGYDDGNEEYQD
mgnify:FL=1